MHILTSTFLRSIRPICTRRKQALRRSYSQQLFQTKQGFMHANNGGSTNSAAKQQAGRTEEKARDEFGGTRRRKAPRNTRKIERPGRTWTTAEAAKGSGESERPWTKERPETPRSERTRRSRQSGHAPAAASGEQPIAGG